MFFFVFLIETNTSILHECIWTDQIRSDHEDMVNQEWAKIVYHQDTKVIAAENGALQFNVNNEL